MRNVRISSGIVVDIETIEKMHRRGLQEIKITKLVCR